MFKKNYKNLAALLLLVLSFVFVGCAKDKVSPQGTESSSGGGDGWDFDIDAYIRKADTFVQRYGGKYMTIEEVERFHEACLFAKPKPTNRKLFISTAEHKECEKESETCKPVSAINTPDTGVLEYNREDLRDMGAPGRFMLVLHEVLGLARIEDKLKSDSDNDKGLDDRPLSVALYYLEPLTNLKGAITSSTDISSIKTTNWDDVILQIALQQSDRVEILKRINIFNPQDLKNLGYREDITQVLTYRVRLTDIKFVSSAINIYRVYFTKNGLKEIRFIEQIRDPGLNSRE